MFEYQLPVAIEELGLKAPRSFEPIAATQKAFEKSNLRASSFGTMLDEDDQKNNESEVMTAAADAQEPQLAEEHVAEPLVTPTPSARTGTKLGSMAAAFFNSVTRKTNV